MGQNKYKISADFPSPYHIEAYLEGRLTGNQAHHMERLMEQDPFLKDAVEGLERLSKKERHAYLQEMAEELTRRTQRSTPRLKYWVVAAIMVGVVLGIGGLGLYLSSNWQNGDDLIVKREVVVVDSVEDPLPEKEKEEALEEDESLSEKANVTRESPVEVLSPVKEKKFQERVLVKREEQREEKSQKRAEIPPASVTSSGRKMALVPKELKSETIGQTTERNSVDASGIRIRGRRTVLEEKDTVTTPVSNSSGFVTEEAKPFVKARSDKGKMEQGYLVSGVIRDRNTEEPLPGVSVFLDGNSSGVVTGVEGDFALVVPGNSSRKLKVAFVGMETKTLTIEQDTTVEILMEGQELALEEVVTVGYGRRSKDYGEDEIIMPQPKDGKKAYKQYLETYVDYPVGYTKKGKVVLMVEVFPNGNLGEITVKRSIGKPFEKEAIRLVRQGPLWEPGQRNGELDTLEVRVVILFKP